MWPCYTALDLALTHKKTKFESSTCIIKKLSNNENINLKMPSFLWPGKLPNRASKIKRLLARHDIYLPRASVKLHPWDSEMTRRVTQPVGD
jgi:hypothetical protein